MRLVFMTENQKKNQKKKLYLPLSHDYLSIQNDIFLWTILRPLIFVLYCLAVNPKCHKLWYKTERE